MFGFTDAPNVVLSGFDWNPDDPRVLHRGWRYVVAENVQRRGPNTHFPTKDAEDSTVHLYFLKDGMIVYQDAAAFLKSDFEPPESMTTLIIGHPRHIPVYLEATAAGVVPIVGVRVGSGFYMTGGRFFHQAFTEQQRLAPGEYNVIVEVKGKWGEVKSSWPLTVPEPPSTHDKANSQRQEA
jgi:hypothetical protein